MHRRAPAILLACLIHAAPALGQGPVLLNNAPNAVPPRPSELLSKPGAPSPPDIAGRTNAALLYYKAWETVDWAAFHAIGESFKSGPEWRPTAAQIETLKSQQKFVDAVTHAAQAEPCEWGIDTLQGPNALILHLGFMRNTARFLGADARRCIMEEDPRGAAKRLVAIIQMSAQMRTDRCLISALVAAAINQSAVGMARQLMAEGALPPESAHVLSAAFRALPEDPFGFMPCMRTERALGLDWVRTHFTGPEAGAQLVRVYLPDAPHAVTSTIEKMDGPTLALELDRTAVYYDELEKLWGQPDKEREFAELERRLAAGEFGPVAQAIAPTVSKANQSNLRCLAAVESIIKDLQVYIRDGELPPPAGPGT